MMLEQSKLGLITSTSIATFALNIDDFNTIDSIAKKNWLGIPKYLSKSPNKRKKEFLAGRYCAQQAFATLSKKIIGSVGINQDRSPKWPKGYIGSITHSDGLVSAAVASKDSIQGVGIDSEKIFTTQVCNEVKDLVLNRKEIKLYSWRLKNKLTYEEFVTLLYSTKESVYKCTNPIFNEFLDFKDIKVTKINFKKSQLTFKFKSNVGFKGLLNQTLVSNFHLDSSFVHTSFELPN